MRGDTTPLGLEDSAGSTQGSLADSATAGLEDGIPLGFAADHCAMNWPLLQNSLLVSGLTTVFAAALGFAVALTLAGVPARWRSPLLLAAVLALVLPRRDISNPPA